MNSLNSTTVAAASMLIDSLLMWPVCSVVQIGFLVWNVWQKSPRLRARPEEPPQMAEYPEYPDPEDLWWEWMIVRLKKAGCRSV